MPKPEAFVIMPFRQPYEDTYSKVISKVLNDCGIEPVRDDKIPRSTPFSSDIEACLRSADLVIAEVSSAENLNVYFELGIANALKKEIILLTHDASTIPADTRHLRHLRYQVEHLDELEKTLKEWVEKSRAFQFNSRRQSPKVLNRGEVFQDIVDATFYLAYRREDDRQEIITCLRNGRLIPTQYLYKFDRGSMLWLDLCQDVQYKYFVNSIDFFQSHVDEILDVIGPDIVNNAPDYISLGPGNGVKDKMFLSKILDRQAIKRADLYYYPFDISPTMISDAIRNVTRPEIVRDCIRIKAVVCDFSRALRSFAPVYQYRLEPNIFTLLGNTLGNMDREVDFLDQIHKAMFPGDILIVEVRTQTAGAVDIGGSVVTNKKFDFTPLDILGVVYKEDKLTYSSHVNRSSIRDTTTLIASYKDFTIPGDKEIVESADLSYVHVYKPESLQRAIKGLQFETLKTFGDEGLACYVLKKGSPH